MYLLKKTFHGLFVKYQKGQKLAYEKLVVGGSHYVALLWALLYVCKVYLASSWWKTIRYVSASKTVVRTAGQEVCNIWNVTPT